MKHSRIALTALTAFALVGADCPGPEPERPTAPVHAAAVEIPYVHDKVRRYRIGSVDATCEGSLLAATVKLYTRQQPKGFACDPWMWNAGGLTQPHEFDVVVRYTLATCRDPWIVLATIEQLGRLPTSVECIESLYNGGSWNSYADLSHFVRTLPISTLSRTPGHWRVFVLVYETHIARGVMRNMCADGTRVVPCDDVWYQSLADFLARLRDTIRERTNGIVNWEAHVQRARVPLVSDDLQGFVEASPASAASELRGFVSQNQYDSIIVVHPGYRVSPLKQELVHWGQGGTILTGNADLIGSQGATYAHVVGPPPGMTWTDPRGIDAFTERTLHEWLHGVEFFYQSKAFRDTLPDPRPWGLECMKGDRSILHVACACFGYPRTATTRDYPMEAYYDFLGGAARSRTDEPPGAYGIPPYVWKTGAPRTNRLPFA